LELDVRKRERAVLDLLPAWAIWVILGTLIAALVGAALFDRMKSRGEK
jgi:hypothetical protein